MNAVTKQGWLARDEDGDLWLYLDEKPEKDENFWLGNNSNYLKMDPNQFSTVKWRDEDPTEVEIIIKLKEQ